LSAATNAGYATGAGAGARAACTIAGGVALMILRSSQTGHVQVFHLPTHK
jgi:hypothetical protein